ncbi:VOC family protein [Kordiimonas laminariae]|uniref:VOC family protein n=1 Tax=Kordiimonas laminariae TaxID=2917717 RepID=UPI001FF3EE70|nr:VOC family protein [Kordiimonas laminariae]MCK0067965.1 VOC family protein [Kordiimonas laminariae]
MPVDRVPEGYSTVAPFMVVSNARKVIDFLKHTFGAEVNGLVYGDVGPSGERLIMNADITVGTSRVFVADARDGNAPAPTSFYCYVEDVDACHARALEAGGVEMMPPMDMFYGDRHGGVIDPCGNTWFIASHIEDVTDEEMQRRADEVNAERRVFG